MKSKVLLLWKSLNSLSKGKRFLVISILLLSAIGSCTTMLGVSFLFRNSGSVTSQNYDPSAEISDFAVVTNEEIDTYQDYEFDRYISPGFQDLYVCGDLEAPKEQRLIYYVYRDKERLPIANEALIVSPGHFCILLDVEKWVSGPSHQVKFYSGRRVMASRVFAILEK